MTIIQGLMNTYGQGSIDPWLSYVKLLAHMEEVNGTTTFTEQYGHSFTVTSGSPSISTSVAKFGKSSFYHPSNSYVSTPASTDFDVTTGAFTIELFVYITAYNTANYNSIALVGNGTSSNGWCFLLSSSANSINFQTFSAGGYKDNITSPTFTQFALNTWHHVAVSFDGTTYSFYADGVRVGTATSAGSVPAGGALAIGAYTQNLSYPSFYWTGYIDEIRITKGVARYSGAFFTVPTVAFR